MFAAIYHPVGTAMLIEQATTRGRSLAFNGVCGNLGVALAAGITAVLASVIGWRGAFVVPAAVCIADRHRSIFASCPTTGTSRSRATRRRTCGSRPGSRPPCSVSSSSSRSPPGSSSISRRWRCRRSSTSGSAMLSLILVGGLATAHLRVRRARAARDGAPGREISAAPPVCRGRALAVRRRAVGGLCDRHRPHFRARGRDRRHLRARSPSTTS